MGEKDTGVFIKADIPPRGMKDTWLNLVQMSCNRVGESLFDLKGTTDIRPVLLTRFVINLIPDPNARQEIKIAWDDLLQEELEIYKNNNGGEMSNDEEGKVNILVALNILGEVSSYVDLHVGIYHRLEIGTA